MRGDAEAECEDEEAPPRTERVAGSPGSKPKVRAGFPGEGAPGNVAPGPHKWQQNVPGGETDSFKKTVQILCVERLAQPLTCKEPR